MKRPIGRSSDAVPIPGRDCDRDRSLRLTSSSNPTETSVSALALAAMCVLHSSIPRVVR